MADSREAAVAFGAETPLRRIDSCLLCEDGRIFCAAAILLVSAVRQAAIVGAFLNDRPPLLWKEEEEGGGAADWDVYGVKQANVWNTNA